MKSILLKAYGHADMLYYKEISKPKIKSKDLLVKVKAVGLNPFDIKLMAGIFQKDIPQEMPIVIGSDFAGSVEDMGERASLFAKGMNVYGSGVSFAGGSGSMAEYLQVNENKVARMPENLNYEEAAGIVTPGCAAQQAVNRHLKVKPGQKILIHGAGGSVGYLATQLCLNIGAHVAVTVDNKFIPEMKDLGVDLIINYNKQPFESLIHDFDGVLDTQGGSVLTHSYQTVKPGGTLVTLVGSIDPAMLEKYNINGIRQTTEISTQTLNTLTFLIEENIIKPKKIHIVPFDDAIQAIDKKIKGHNSEKIVIAI